MAFADNQENIDALFVCRYFGTIESKFLGRPVLITVAVCTRLDVLYFHTERTQYIDWKDGLSK